MKHLFIIIAMLAFACGLKAQDADSTMFKGSFTNSEFKLNCFINLYNKVVPVPGAESEECYGYINGNTNGLWAILRVKEMKDGKAIVRAVSERGEDAQTLEIKSTDNGITIRQIDGANIKGVANSKYVKLPKLIELNK